MVEAKKEVKQVIKPEDELRLRKITELEKLIDAAESMEEV